jgi:hypothetical protein
MEQTTEQVDTTKGENFNTKEVLMESAEDQKVMEQVFTWSMGQIKQETQRLNSLGVSPIDIQIIDMSVLVQGNKLQLNRVVFNTELDFNQVNNIMISPEQHLPMKEGFKYVHVLLFGKGKPETTPIIFPYVYKNRLRGGKNKQGKNTLKHWVLVNNKCEEAYHCIKNFTTVV